jgi:dTDP-4-dehydrorhamnose 3,5-epimerase
MLCILEPIHVSRFRHPWNERRASAHGQPSSAQLAELHAIFTETKLREAFVVELERKQEERGFFARAFCQDEFRAYGLKLLIAQANIAHSIRKGTVGMLFDFPPAAETNDIIAVLRPESPTNFQHVAVKLNEDNHRALNVSERFAHGCQTLQGNTDTSYSVGEFYTVASECGIPRNDLRLGLEWPLPATVVSEEDQKFAAFDLRAI